ncbi:hypothetical protein LL947_11720 [Halomonas sp. BLK-85]
MSSTNIAAILYTILIFIVLDIYETTHHQSNTTDDMTQTIGEEAHRIAAPGSLRGDAACAVPVSIEHHIDLTTIPDACPAYINRNARLQPGVLVGVCVCHIRG